jgi:ribonuclease VapC
VILDTSAILAVFFGEPEADEFLHKIGAATIVGVGAPTVVESAIVLAARLGEAGPPQLARVIERAGLVVIPFAQAHWQVAADAWLRFGKGRHPAALNFGDCLAYATAQLAGRPLLCKGDDFAKTDLPLAYLIE